jgi:hypothetical protein
MAKYKGRVPSPNMVDIRTGRGSPDDRQEQKRKRNRYLDDAWATNTLKTIGLQDVPQPKPDPRTKMPGGELAIGRGQSRQEYYQGIAEEAHINSVANPYDVYLKATRPKKGESFWGAFKDIWFNMDDRVKRTEVEMRNQEQFLLDSFKQARAVGYKPASISTQPAPLPMQFKVKQ